MTAVAQGGDRGGHGDIAGTGTEGGHVPLGVPLAVHT